MTAGRNERRRRVALVKAKPLPLILGAVVGIGCIALVVVSLISGEIAMALLGLVIGGFLALAAESRYSAWRRSSLIAQRQRRELTAVTDSVSKSVKSAAWRAAKTAAHDVSTAATERTKAEKKKADRAAADARDKAAAVAAQKATDEQVRLILGSRVFDIEWYHAQIAGELPTAERAVLHYLDRGRRAGFTPHPLFDPAEISRTWRKDATDPLVAYLRNERGLWSRATSPFFDPAAVDEDLPVSEYGPLSSFLLNRGQDYPLPAAGDVLPAGTKVPILRDLRRHLMAASADWRVREELVAPTRGATSVDASAWSAESALKTVGIDVVSTATPLVSVVLPTWNRAEQLRAAIDSVCAQSYDNWELIVADDGSVDDTAAMVRAQAENEPRLKFLELPHRGVSATRNSALREASGEYVAFLDSDKVWVEDFLAAMVGYLESTSHEAAYCIVEISRDGKKFFRSRPAPHESLVLGNSIDQTAIMVRRSVLQRIDGFDETLPRAVDYDLVLSISSVAELHQVPFVGLQYSEDDQDPNRISEAQSVAWNRFVSDRYRWRTETLPDLDPALTSIVVDGVRSYNQALELIHNLDQHAALDEYELLLVTHSNVWAEVRSLAAIETVDSRVRIVPATSAGFRPQWMNAAIRLARGARLVVLTASQRLVEGQLRDWLGLLEQPSIAAVHPLVLDDRGLIGDAGVIYAPGGNDPVPFLRGLPQRWPAWNSDVVPVPGAGLPLAMRTAEVRELQGFDTRLGGLWVDVDLSQRLRGGDRMVALTPRNVVSMRGHLRLLPVEAFQPTSGTFDDTWRQGPAGSREACEAAGVTPHFTGFKAISAPDKPDMWTVATWLPRAGDLSVKEQPTRLRWAIKTAAPADERAKSWGDVHFGQSLARALQRLGQHAYIDHLPAGSRETGYADDVVVNLRGLSEVSIPATACSIIWVISHPDQVTAKELKRYDLRYAASLTWPKMIADQWGVEVAPLLQCTDPTLFFLDTPAEEVADQLLMVGNSRKQYRPAAWNAAQAKLPLSVYGTHWEELIDPQYVKGTYLPNDQLRHYYRGARWTLNDHWTDMREFGFISNRIFDVLAAGGRLLTDDVPGLDTVFERAGLPNGIAAFNTPIEFLKFAKSDPEMHYGDESLQAVSDFVRAEHTFDVRAKTMLEDVRRLLANR